MNTDMLFGATAPLQVDPAKTSARPLLISYEHTWINSLPVFVHMTNGARKYRLCADTLLTSHNTWGHQLLLETANIVNMLEPVNMLTIFMDDPNINKLLVLKNKRLRRLQKQTLLTLFVNFIVVSIPYPFILVCNQKILELVDFSLFLAILFTWSVS